MKSNFLPVCLLFISFLVLYSCKSDDGSGYIPLNIKANPDMGEVFQNSTLEISIFDNDINVPEMGTVVLTAPQSGTAVINDNGTPDNLLDDTVKYTPNGSFIGEVSFEYTVCDPTEQSCATATVSINVLPFSPVNFEISEVPYDKLSDYNFYEGNLSDLSPVYGVLPYEPINSLFADYSRKKRFVWMPND